MCKQITSKVTLILLVVGVMSNSFKSQASPIIEMSKVSVSTLQTNNTQNKLPVSKDAEDIVVEEPVMFNFSSNTTCNVSSTLKKYAGESMGISVGNNPIWRASFKVGSSTADIVLSYDVQSDRLSFDKSLSSGVTYTVDPNGTFIDFYINGNAFFSITDMKTCDNDMCATINFSMNNTVFRRYECTSNGGSNALVGRNNVTSQHTNTKYQPIGEATDIMGGNLKRSLIQTHQASPNPFTNNATITYNLTADAEVRVTIYNSVGQQISVLVNQSQTKGVNTIDWEAAATLRGGLYFYEIIANNERMVGKLTKQ
jgi:hypothetical protein